jgi:hypothetical protein
VQGKKGWLEKLDRICPLRNLWDNATMPSAMTSPSKARRRVPAVRAVLLPLQGKRILLGISGGVAAYKSALLARLLIKAGADVRVVLTAAGARFITAASLQALTGQPVSTDLWDARIPDSMGHISLSRDRDLILVAPASADFMAKVAQGHGDDLLSTICLARRCPLALAPAMNVEMWQRAPNQRNLALLQSLRRQWHGAHAGGRGAVAAGGAVVVGERIATAGLFAPAVGHDSAGDRGPDL